MKQLITYSVLSFFASFVIAQNNRISFSNQLEWDTDSTLLLQSKLINYGDEVLLNQALIPSKNQSRKLPSIQKDSVFIKSGISVIKSTIIFPKGQQVVDSKTIDFRVAWSDLDGATLFEEILSIPSFPPLIVSVGWTDSSIYVSNEKMQDYVLSIKVQDIEDEKKNSRLQFETNQKDTSLFLIDLIKERPLSDRYIIYQLRSNRKLVTEDSILYRMGKFEALDSSVDSSETKDELAINSFFSLNGTLSIENNSFSETPAHSNAQQYPNTVFSASNNINIGGIPLNLDAFYNSNDNIDRNFRNFFSLRFDVNAFRQSKKEELLGKNALSGEEYMQLRTDVDLNNASIERLNNLKHILEEYPNEDIEVDSLLSKENAQLIASERKDSIANVYVVDSLGNSDSLSTIPVDSSNLNHERIKEINGMIDRLEQSNETKEKYRQLQRNYPNDLDFNYSPNSLYSYFGDNVFSSVLLRFDKLEIGNFYEYAGKYSIRDIEIIGVNSALLVAPKWKAHFLSGRINNYQLFNIDGAQQANDRISSYAISNTSYDYLNFSLRLTQSSAETSLEEGGSQFRDNYVVSTIFTGDLGSIAYYELEYNQSTGNLNQLAKESDDFTEKGAIYSLLKLSPFKFLDFNLQYDRVGAAYNTKGVYFLNRNLQSYSLGYHLRLFKNKVYIKNDYTVLQRNIENEELDNESEKLFFDVGTRFRRYPNIQVIYSPITLDIANKLDTSFSNLSATSTATIGRIFYHKRVKRTILQAAVIYSEIDNDFFDASIRQRSTQTFASWTGERLNFSISSAYFDVFKQLRFISLSGRYQLSDRINTNLYLAQNFSEQAYDAIIRNRWDILLGKRFTVGAGAIFLFDDNYSLTVGSTVGLKFHY